MNSFAAFLKSFVVRTWGGMYIPAIDGDEASCLIDSSRSAAWFSPTTHLLGLIDEQLNALGQLRAAVGQRVGTLLHLRNLGLCALRDC